MKTHQSHLAFIGCASTVLLWLFACSNGHFPADTLDDSFHVEGDYSFSNVASASTQLGFKLIASLREREPGQNIFISPVSISIALTMTYNGAVGETERAMAEVLEIKELELSTVNRSNAALIQSLETHNPKVQLSIANSIWSRQGVEFSPEFLDRNRQFFEAQITSLDFVKPESAEIINEWVNTSTKGKIAKIVQRIDPQTLIFLINAIYFNGSWETRFERSETRNAIFHLEDGGEKQVRMMHREGEYLHLRDDSFEAVRLPYGDGRMSMYIFLPNRDSNLNEFLAGVSGTEWIRWRSQFRQVPRDSVIILPRFKLEYEVKLNEALKALGMGIAFGAGADFRSMGPGLFISEVRHKSFIEVNEEGTEAAAATVVSGVRSLPSVFRADRPFFFAVYDQKTTTLLFLGIITEPM